MGVEVRALFARNQSRDLLPCILQARRVSRRIDAPFKIAVEQGRFAPGRSRLFSIDHVRVFVRSETHELDVANVILDGPFEKLEISN